MMMGMIMTKTFCSHVRQCCFFFLLVVEQTQVETSNVKTTKEGGAREGSARRSENKERSANLVPPEDVVSKSVEPSDPFSWAHVGGADGELFVLPDLPRASAREHVVGRSLKALRGAGKHLLRKSLRMKEGRDRVEEREGEGWNQRVSV